MTFLHVRATLPRDTLWRAPFLEARPAKATSSRLGFYSGSRRSVAITLRPAAAANGPGSAGDVVAWAVEAFRSEAGRADLNLVKSCMLVALEEEAAAQAHYLREEGYDQASLAQARSAASASTWSLERLDSLAAQIAHLFYARCAELGVASELQAAAQSGACDEDLLALHAGLVRGYPMQLLGAVNEVLFSQQGYSRMKSYGDPRDSTLSAVLEGGRGSHAALAVLYREVCARLGLHLQAAVLEGGHYLLLWPLDSSVRLSVGGERFVIDAYAGGELYSEEEVCMLFGVEDGSLTPATSQQILAALLKELQDSHWCRSLGCPAAPALMVPPSLDLALGISGQEGQVAAGDAGDAGAAGTGGEPEAPLAEDSPEQQQPQQPQQRRQQPQQQQQLWPAQGHHLERAVAAARKRALLLPSSRSAQLELALLLFFAGDYSAARRELGVLLLARHSVAKQPQYSSGSRAAAGEVAVGQELSAQELGRLELLHEKCKLLEGAF